MNYFALDDFGFVNFLAAPLAGAAFFVDALAAGFGAGLAGAAFFGSAVLALGGLALA